MQQDYHFVAHFVFVPSFGAAEVVILHTQEPEATHSLHSVEQNVKHSFSFF